MRRWALAAVVCGSALVGVPASAAVSVAGNRRLARSDAARLLTRVRLPLGSVRSVGEPAGDRGILRSAALTSARMVADRHEFWIVPGDPGAVDTWVLAHRPRGSVQNQSGSIANPGGENGAIEGFVWPAVRGRLSTRQVVYVMTALADGNTGVRVDAQDLWITPRARSERIPARAGQLIVELRRFGNLVAGPFVFTGAGRIGRATALLNALPRAQPGPYSCPADSGFVLRLTFLAAGRVQPLAVADVDPGGCNPVGLTLTGRAQPTLTSLPFPGSGLSTRHPLIDQLDGALGLRLAAKLEPPSISSK